MTDKHGVGPLIQQPRLYAVEWSQERSAAGTPEAGSDSASDDEEMRGPGWKKQGSDMWWVVLGSWARLSSDRGQVRWYNGHR